jgi:integrase
MNFRRTDISMQELTPDFIKEFAVYLSNDRGLASSTIWLTCMHLKGVVGRAHDNGKIQRNVFAQFHISPKCKERTFLTEEELRTVMAHEFEDSSLAFVRDLFVFMNFTALSFVDLKELTSDNIVEVNGEKWIVGKRHKTGVPYQVKLLAVPLQIIERYRDYPKANPKSVFGEVNYWSVCKKLKPVMKECGIDKPISAHCARHGFATMALTNGMPIESVSRVLGHTNIVTTQIYARITTQKLDNDLTMLGNKLNQSFSNNKRA